MEKTVFADVAISSDLEKDKARLAMALLGIPSDATREWVVGQVGCRVAEALCRGATEEQARNWATAWADLVGGVIAWSAG